MVPTKGWVVPGGSYKRAGSARWFLQKGELCPMVPTKGRVVLDGSDKRAGSVRWFLQKGG